MEMEVCLISPICACFYLPKVTDNKLVRRVGHRLIGVLGCLYPLNSFWPDLDVCMVNVSVFYSYFFLVDFSCLVVFKGFNMRIYDTIKSLSLVIYILFICYQKYRTWETLNLFTCENSRTTSNNKKYSIFFL